jgi:Tol biopolymer transport system component
VDAQGRNPVQLTATESEGTLHLRPRWSPDGTRIVFQVQRRTVFDLGVVEVESRRTLALTDDPFRDLNPVWSGDAANVYFSSDRSGGYNIWRIGVDAEGIASGGPQQVSTGPGQDVDLAMAPDGSRLAFSILKQNADLWSLPVSPDTGEPTGAPAELVSTTREDSRGAWSPDGSLVAFNSDRAGHMNIWVHDTDDGATRQLTEGPGGDFQPRWSPDGKRLTFFSSREGNPDIWVMELDGSGLTRLTDSDAAEVNPEFSPDGQRIAYQSDEDGRREVWVMQADGSQRRALTAVGVSGHYLRWSSGSDAVIFRCPCGGEGAVMRAALAGGEPSRLPGEILGGYHLSFSPDGSHIMDVAGHRTLWVSSLDGAAPRQVFQFDEPSARIDYPVWSPDGGHVLFDRFQPQGGDLWIMDGF